MENNEVFIAELMERSGRVESLNESERSMIKRRVMRSKRLMERGLADIGKAYDLLEDIEDILEKKNK